MVEEWNSIPETTIINLVDSMRGRCGLVIETMGNEFLIEFFTNKSPYHKLSNEVLIIIIGAAVDQQWFIFLLSIIMCHTVPVSW